MKTLPNLKCRLTGLFHFVVFALLIFTRFALGAEIKKVGALKALETFEKAVGRPIDSTSITMAAFNRTFEKTSESIENQKFSRILLETKLARIKKSFHLSTGVNESDSAANRAQALSEVALSKNVPYDIRVKYALTLALVCQTQIETRGVCTSSQVFLNAAGRNDEFAKSIAHYLSQTRRVPRSKNKETQLVNSESLTTAVLPASVKREVEKQHEDVVNALNAPIHWYGFLLVAISIAIFLQLSRRTQSKKRAIVIDDDVFSLTASKKVLSSLGYHVEVFSEPNEAIRCIKRKAFDVFVIDYLMPKMTGEKLARFLEEEDLLKKTQQLFMWTANSNLAAAAIQKSGLQHSVQIVDKVQNLASLRQFITKSSAMEMAMA